MTKPLPMPPLGRCPYCGHKLKAYTTTALDFVPRVSHTYCPNDRCCENRDYATERGAINAANRRAFTLIEMLVALALASIIMSVVVVAFAQGILIYKQSSAKIEASRSAYAVLGILEEDMRSIPAQPVLFVSDGDSLNLMFLSMTTFGVPDDMPGTALKVGYYVTEANELMRVSIPAAATTYTADDTEKLVYGMTQFELRYYYKGQWYDNWDSLDPSDSIQFQRHPDVLEVRMRVVDYDGYLERAGQNAIVVTRLIQVGG